ncbi:MAG: glycosyl hydrolase family 17, partial [Flavobacteriaceae bacterium]|nr:glycosyl hydrolase family 17 [Flavobacteriaceae bacterium]
DILGNPEYLAISYGGYRMKTRDSVPSVEQIKEDMKILAAMNIKMLRTYNVHLNEVPNLLEAISQLKKEEQNFEMYVMLGAWIDCKNAWTNKEPIHNEESERNAIEIETAVSLTNKYPDIVKIIAVGNEAMVKWATSYYVEPHIILKWVNHLQELKKSEKLPSNLWITSSDNFASWGGGDASYHTEDLKKLFHAVDYISMHTYPFHNSHYNPTFWKVPENEESLTELEKIDAAMLRAKGLAISQYQAVSDYMKSIGINKPIHIGETGWTSSSDGYYGNDGSRAADEYKAGLYYKHMRDWTKETKMSCFYFEAFDEQWKDAANPLGSENHFGLITLDGQAKFPLWDLVDQGAFNGLTRDGKSITKTYNGDKAALLKEILPPPNAK